MRTDPLEQVRQSRRCAAQIEFLDRALMLIRADGYALPISRATCSSTVMTGIQCRSVAGNRPRALPTCKPHLLASSHPALPTMRLTRAAIQTEPILADWADPLSHTAVSDNASFSHHRRAIRPSGQVQLATLTAAGPPFTHLTNSQSRPRSAYRTWAQVLGFHVLGFPVMPIGSWPHPRPETHHRQRRGQHAKPRAERSFRCGRRFYRNGTSSLCVVYLITASCRAQDPLCRCSQLALQMDATVCLAPLHCARAIVLPEAALRSQHTALMRARLILKSET